jgi:hypothetical protein
MQHFQLSKVPMVGASGGGLAAVLATCDVDPEEVMESAYRLSKQHNIWERPLGLMGTWGYVIEEWLDELLPADAAERCRDQVGWLGSNRMCMWNCWIVCSGLYACMPGFFSW